MAGEHCNFGEMARAGFFVIQWIRVQ
jgi:hypothetical protein